MGMIAYTDNGILMADAYLRRNYVEMANQIRNCKDNYTYVICDNDDVFAYEITKNESLSEIYGFDCFVVKFAFSNVDSLHQDEQERVLEKLCQKLKDDITDRKGYFNFRIPSHISDLIRVFNDVFTDVKRYFCGGTVEYVQTTDACKEFEKHPEVKLFYADKAFLKANSETLIGLAHEGFRSYQGQYHISPVTSDSAGQIYADWIRNSMNDQSNDEVLIAEVDQHIAGYCTFRRTSQAYEGVLSSVDPEYRKHSIYKSLISYLASEAQKEGCFFLSSTQFDNYIVQGVWISLGLKPFASIYNYHLNCLD